MKNNENYDFYAFGKQKSKELIKKECAKLAFDLGKEYGYDAKELFVIGYLEGIVEELNSGLVESIMKNEESIDISSLHATKNFGIHNTRNNTYFGTYGIGIQYKEDGTYNEPKTLKRK